MSRETKRSLTSPVDRREALLSLTAFAALGPASGLSNSAFAQAQAGEPLDVDAAIRALFSNDPPQVAAGLSTLSTYDNVDIAPSLIFALRFAGPLRGPIELTLRRVTGEDGLEGWFDWMLWQEQRPEVVPHPSYYAFKRDLFLSIDPNFEIFLDPKHLGRDAARIRFEEVTWGGVPKDGIPSLDNPKRIAAAQADYLKPDDLVFGVAIDGDARAYPLRIMGWHEMFNDVIGGVPLALAYCTLCGAGFLFETQVEGRSEPFTFGSSGFLYRSNKLMFDRQTHTLWNQYTGEPALGPLADEKITLVQRPVTIAPWSEWRREHPDTTVLSLETGHRRDYGSGVVYQEYFASADLMFPALVDQSRVAQKEFVFGVETAGGARAWPLTAFEGGGAGGVAINDRVAGLSLALIGDAAGRTVRAYDRGAREFELDGEGRLVSDGAVWRRTEDALIGPNGETAPRIPGKLSYWFAWNGYLGGTATLYPN